MLAVLDRVIRENELSYTHCFFQQPEGKQIALEKKPGLMLWPPYEGAMEMGNDS